jgi:hypothetical protein
VDAGGVKAELARAGRENLVSARDPRRRTALLRTAKPRRPGRRCHGQAVRRCAQAQPGERHRQFEWRGRPKGKFGSRESAAYWPSDHRAGKAWYRLPCVSPVHGVCICSARGSLRVPAGARPSLHPFFREGVKRSTARANHCRETANACPDQPATIAHGSTVRFQPGARRGQHNLNRTRLGLSLAHSKVSCDESPA